MQETHKLYEPADLELNLRRKDATHYGVDLVFSQPGSEADTRPLGQHVVTVRFDEKKLLACALDAEQYGRALGQMLFADQRLMEAFAWARTAAAVQNRLLRLRLVMSVDAPELHMLRWETLCIPGDTLPLALNEHIAMQGHFALDTNAIPDGLLLRGEALARAETETHEATLNRIERDFLAACQSAHAAEQRERRQNQRIQGLAGAALL